MRPRVFKDPKVLRQMLNLYAESGQTILSLSRKYHCDHSSILYQVRKHGVVRGVPIVKQKRLESQEIDLTWDVVTKKHTCCQAKRRTYHNKYCPVKGIPKPVYKYQHLFDQMDTICQGKFYADYLKDYKKKVQPILKENLQRAKETLKNVKGGQFVPPFNSQTSYRH